MARMSAVANFIKLPKSALVGLREAAVPKKRSAGRPRTHSTTLAGSFSEQSARD